MKLQTKIYTLALERVETKAYIAILLVLFTTQ